MKMNHRSWLISAVALSVAVLGKMNAAVTTPNDSDESPTEMTDALNKIADMDPLDAAKEASALARALNDKATSTAEISLLRLGAARERSGDSAGARQAFDRLCETIKDGPYAASAGFRSRALSSSDLSAKGKEKLYETIASEPDADGWFLASGRWAWGSARRAAWQALVDLRSDRLSQRLLAFLRAKSTFPTPYGYLFTLLALAVSAKMLELPLLVRGARVVAQMRTHSREIAGIHAAYASDISGLHERLTQFYRDHGINVASGCLVMLADIIFTIWALVTMSAFSPQMALDGARFWWVADVTHFDLGIVVLSLAAGAVTAALNPAVLPRQAGQMMVGLIISGSITTSMAWYWKWPAYVFIFWAVLALLGVLISRTFVPIQARLLASRAT